MHKKLRLRLAFCADGATTVSRIVFLCNRFLPSIGGIEQHVFSLAREMVNEGHQVLILTTNVVKDQPTSLPSFEVIEGISVLRLKVSLWKGYLKQFHFCPSLIAELGRLRPDVVHVHSYWPYYLTNVGLLLSKILRISTVITPHYHPLRSRRFSIYTSVCGPLILHFADCVIALTKSEAAYYRQIGIKSIAVIPNGTSLPNVEEEKLVKAFSKMHGLGNSVVLSVGRIEKRKGFECLIRAIHLLIREFPSIQLAVVGRDAGFLGQLESLVRKLKLTKHFVYLGALRNDELSLAYESSYLVAIASSYEAFGITTIEAWAHKRPVIATKVGGLADIVPPDAGILVDYGNVEDLAKAIRVLLLDRALHKRMGLRGFGLVKDNYRWSKVAEKVVNVYRYLRRGDNS